MEALALRLVLPPLVIAGATLAQGRLGDRLGGLVVGLPLTSGTFLGLLLLSQGGSATAHAAAGMLAGQVSVVVMAATYAWLASRAEACTAIAGTVLTWAASVPVVHAVDSSVAIGVLYVAAVLAVLLRWPTPTAAEGDPPPTVSSGQQTAIRVTLGSGLVIALTAGVQVLGPVLAGTLAAAPLVALVLTPSTHVSRGPTAVRILLKGVVLGSVGAAAFAVIVLLSAEALGGAAIGMAVLACLAVVALTGMTNL